MRVVAILETMWDWRSMTSGAGYAEAPRFFRINPENHSGRRLHKLVGPHASLLVTNACRELVNHANKHGKPDPAWLAENLSRLDEPPHPIAVLLVCGRVAQATFAACTYKPSSARVVNMPHPAARQWTKANIEHFAHEIQFGDLT